MAENTNALTVTSLNEYIKRVIDADSFLSGVLVKGEISNFVYHRTGHLYFTLKDENSLIKSVMFSFSASKLKFMPENGMKVIVHGRVAAFTRDGTYNLYCDRMEPDGIGALYVAYEQLKKKLEAEGLFAQERKRPLPKIPTRIGVITSPTGAAVRDIINVVTRRFKYAKIVLYPSLVQGESAPAQLISGVKYFNENKAADVIILGRGGGSIEDLWAFNDEGLARAVSASQIPIISAVGHETDFTICDFIADRRAPTPSAAAEIAVPDTTELMRKINNITGRMELLLYENIKRKSEKLSMLAKSKVLADPIYMLDEKRARLLSSALMLEGNMRQYLSVKENRLAAISPRLDALMTRQLADKKNEFVSLTSKLEALNPLSVLSRGFSAVFGDDGKLVKSSAELKVGDKIGLRLKDGEVKASVTSVEFKEN
ncbi:MAG: exodeoxyribonuclease VII large subunit [Clostridia bacterium]|nr:exodeoxyribonuclease VII large subunit [Clostridia bacterium]